VLRFQPRVDGAQTVLSFKLEVYPTPAGVASWPDAAGNVVTQAWFEGVHQCLEINSHAIVQTVRENPFDYLLDARCTRLPIDYGAEATSLYPYLQRSKPPADEQDEIATLASRMRCVSGDALIPLLTALNNTLYKRLTVVRRDEGAPWAPQRTWRERSGACRDVAVLFVDACRALGIAARFVSGYEAPCGHDQRCDLHAWAEVYVPGGGWRGYDPSRGLAVANNHVAVAAAADSELTTPISGAFRGDEVQATMESEIHISLRDDVPFQAAAEATCVLEPSGSRH
jgi:transglutaminase-like putative cysteine protease